MLKIDLNKKEYEDLGLGLSIKKGDVIITAKAYLDTLSKEEEELEDMINNNREEFEAYENGYDDNDDTLYNTDDVI